MGARSNPSVPYFARTIRGLEDLSWQDIARHSSSKLDSISHRTISFSSSSDPQSLTELRGIEDLFVHVESFADVGHERAALTYIQEQANSASLERALSTVAEVRPLPRHPSFSITASFVGSRNFSRWDLASSLRAGFAKQTRDWKYVETKGTSAPPHDLNIRLLLEGGSAHLGLRLSAAPLHKRPYLKYSLAAALSPVVAYHMVRLSSFRAHQVLLDPMCGVGTLPIEASLAEPEAIVMAMDIDSEAVAMAAENACAAHASVSALQGNIFDARLEKQSIDVIATDLPWGTQSILNGGNVKQLSETLASLLRPGGTAVLMTDNPSELTDALQGAAFRIEDQIGISLHGRHPTILRVQR